MGCVDLLWTLLTTFGEVTWEFVKAVVVPLVAAGAAALVVIVQIRRSDQHRAESQRGEGVKAGCRLFLYRGEAASGLATAPSGSGGTTMEVINAHSYLVGADKPIAQWIGWQNTFLGDAYNQLLRDLSLHLAKGYLGETAAMTAERDRIVRESANNIERLLDWQQGTLPTQWFVDQMRAAGVH